MHNNLINIFLPARIPAKYHNLIFQNAIKVLSSNGMCENRRTYFLFKKKARLILCFLR